MTTALLALETATDACSAALWRDGETLERRVVAPREHAARLLPMVEGLLAEAGMPGTGLDAVAFGRGPGSFTGLRIAAGVAQGLALAWGLPVVPVSTLAALAQDAIEDGAGAVLAALDARMGEVYWGAFRAGEEGLAVPAGAERVCPPDAVEFPGPGPWVGAGPGWEAHGGALRARTGGALARVEPGRLPWAGRVARLAAAALARGEAVPPEEALPVYLRSRVADAPRG